MQHICLQYNSAVIVKKVVFLQESSVSMNCALGLEGYHSLMLGLGVRVRY